MKKTASEIKFTQRPQVLVPVDWFERMLILKDIAVKSYGTDNFNYGWFYFMGYLDSAKNIIKYGKRVE